VSTLNKLTELNVRLIDLKRWGRYPQDIIFEESVDEAVDVVSGADIIHFHNYIGLDTDVFNPIDFREFQKKGIGLLRQFRTSPTTLEINTGVPVEKILSPDIPSIVIAQFHERYYPNARVVPNAIPTDRGEYTPTFETPVYDICYSPSRMTYAWSSRWDTKGAPETVKVLQEIEKKTRAKNIVVYNKKLTEVLETKQKSKIIIDDLVTGSYHASGLEGLCLAKAVLCFLDHRTEKVLKEISGSAEIPFINTHLFDAGDVLLDLVQNDELITLIGERSRSWINTYWSENIIAERYLRVYEDLLCNPELVKRQDTLRVDGEVKRYCAVTLPDILYDSQRKRYKKAMSIGEKIKKYFNQNISLMRKKISKQTPEYLLKRYRKLKLNT